MTVSSRPLTLTASPEVTPRSAAICSGSSTSPSCGAEGREAATSPSGAVPNRAREVTAESVSIRICPTESGSVCRPAASSQAAAWSESTWESDQEISSPRVGVSTILSAGSASIAEMFWWARPRVRPVSSTSSRVSRAITPIMSVNLPLAWTMSLSATNMPPSHPGPRPRTSPRPAGPRSTFRTMPELTAARRVSA